jgi:hypothetical protein
MMTYTEGAPREAKTTTSQSQFQIQHDEADGDTLADRYQVLEELGSGSFGVVYKAIEKATGEIVAIKHVRCNILVAILHDWDTDILWTGRPRIIRRRPL